MAVPTIYAKLIQYYDKHFEGSSLTGKNIEEEKKTQAKYLHHNSKRFIKRRAFYDIEFKLLQHTAADSVLSQKQ